MTRSLQLYCVRVTAFSQTDLFLDWISREWDSHRSPMTNYRKLSWRHRVTKPELPLFFSGKDSLKIGRSVKMPLHRPSMGAVGSGSWVPGPGHIGGRRVLSPQRHLSTPSFVWSVDSTSSVICFSKHFRSMREKGLRTLLTVCFIWRWKNWMCLQWPVRSSWRRRVWIRWTGLQQWMCSQG